MSKLSAHDSAILNCVFNPNLPLSEAFEDEEIEELKDTEVDIPDLEKIKEIEIQAITEAETKNYAEALRLINIAIVSAPTKGSLLNNRAQIYQFLGKYEEAIEDLTSAINLSREKQHKTLCQALCQRGLICRKNDNIDMARRDFEEAAKFGSKFGKKQVS